MRMRNPLSVFRDRVSTPIMEEMVKRVPRFVKSEHPNACCADCGVSAREAFLLESKSYGHLCSACMLLSAKFDLAEKFRVNKSGDQVPVDIQLPGTKGAGTGVLIQGNPGQERIALYLPPRPMVFEQFIPKDVTVLRSPGQKSIFQDFYGMTLPLMMEAKKRDPGEPFCWAWLSMNDCHKAHRALAKWSLDEQNWLAFFQEKTVTLIYRLSDKEWENVYRVVNEERREDPAFTKKTVIDYVRAFRFAPRTREDSEVPLTEKEIRKQEADQKKAFEKRRDLENRFPWLLDSKPMHFDTFLRLMMQPVTQNLPGLEAVDRESEAA